jgi:hypothetical protein
MAMTRTLLSKVTTGCKSFNFFRNRCRYAITGEPVIIVDRSSGKS